MMLGIVAGAGIATGICLLVTGLAPAPPPLARALAQLNKPPSGHPRRVTAEPAPDLDTRLGRRLRRWAPIDRAVQALSTDLRILDRSPDQQVAQLVAYGLVGLFWAPAVAAGCRLLGVDVPLLIPAWLAIAGAALMIWLPYRHVRTEATQARAGFAHALSAFCDVAAMALSAGQETHGALFDAATAGSGTAFDEIHTALQRGHFAGQSPAESLAQLGHDLGIEDIIELGNTLSLAEREGAPVSDTIAAKARSIRERLVNDIERSAARATERMAIPGAMLMIGFLWFIAFPALYLIFEEAH